MHQAQSLPVFCETSLAQIHFLRVASSFQFELNSRLPLSWSFLCLTQSQFSLWYVGDFYDDLLSLYLVEHSHLTLGDRHFLIDLFTRHAGLRSPELSDIGPCHAQPINSCLTSLGLCLSHWPACCSFYIRHRSSSSTWINTSTGIAVSQRMTYRRVEYSPSVADADSFGLLRPCRPT